MSPGLSGPGWPNVTTPGCSPPPRRPSMSSGERGGYTFTLRWVITHMIEEYARHNGHADLLRERIDGSTGE